MEDSSKKNKEIEARRSTKTPRLEVGPLVGPRAEAPAAVDYSIIPGVKSDPAGAAAAASGAEGQYGSIPDPNAPMLHRI